MSLLEKCFYSRIDTQAKIFHIACPPRTSAGESTTKMPQISSFALMAGEDYCQGHNFLIKEYIGL
jgi:hypothetical protein